ncbi:MAG: hypothetical protein AAFZ17_20455 [Cyanobacteria bacterium J06650_10]
MAIERKNKMIKNKAVGSLLGVAGALVAVGVLAPGAIAQDSIPEVVDRISEQRSGNYYTNQSFFSQIGQITGLGGFPEHRMNRDTAAVSGTAQELMMLQTQNTPTMRVPDLPNPYNTSVQLLPTSQFNSRVIGSELNFEPLPRR